MLPVSKFSHLPGGYYFTIDSYGEDEFFFFFFFRSYQEFSEKAAIYLSLSTAEYGSYLNPLLEEV